MTEKEIPVGADLNDFPGIGVYKQDSGLVEARHGRWIVRGQEIYCSECNEEGLYNPFGASKFSRFCPNCGARMEQYND